MDVRVGLYKESWVPKNKCFWTVVLEKTLEIPLDHKEMQAVHPKGNQSWIFIERTEAETLILWPPDVKNWLIGKDPDAGIDWKQEEKGRQRMRWLDGITNSRGLLKLMSFESMMSSNHLILCLPFSSRLLSLPASGSFQMSQLFASGGRSIGVLASTSVLPMNNQDWFPLGWTGWISLQSKGLSRVFSNTTVQKHQFFGAQLYL